MTVEKGIALLDEIATRMPDDARRLTRLVLLGGASAGMTTIGGVPADRKVADLMKLASGTAQWRERRALSEAITCQPGAKVAVALETSAGARTSSLTCDTKAPPTEKRPNAIAELSTGVWYVDLSRATMNEIRL